MLRNNPAIKNFLFLLLIASAGFVWYKYRQPRFTAGENPPDFSWTQPDGTPAKMSDLKGKYKILQFWGSWCGPCRAENPHLSQLYRKYHDAGFEIVSVALDNNPNNWQRAIMNDQMTWKYHTRETQSFDGPLAKMYNIKSIPAIFLLNPDGVIMYVNPPLEQVDKVLSTNLNVR